jgi:hypothetical protein
MSDTRTTPPAGSGYRGTQPNRTGWVGWVFFAGVMMIFMGSLHAIDGLVGIFKKEVYVAGANGQLVVSWNYTTWGWIFLIVGIIVICAGFAVMTGAIWARIIGITVAGISMIVNIAFLAAFPIWSLILIGLDVVVIYALAVHGGELKEQ